MGNIIVGKWGMGKGFGWVLGKISPYPSKSPLPIPDSPNILLSVGRPVVLITKIVVA